MSNMKRLAILLPTILIAAVMVSAQDEVPTINPQGAFMDAEGKEETGTSFSGSAPVTARFEANPENVGSWSENYEWRFTLEQEGSTPNPEPYLVRYERDTEYTFTQAGTHKIVCYAIFTLGSDTIAYTKDYYQGEGVPISISIAESKLDMPNAFTPNDEEPNNIFKARNQQSIIEFEAAVFTRSGRKIYEWKDPEGGWDGKDGSKDAPDGVYYLHVKAKGADRREYKINQAITLLRKYREDTGITSE